MFRFERFLFFIAVFETTRLMTPLYGLGATETLQNSYMVTREECLNAANSSVVRNTCCPMIDMDDEPVRVCLQMKVTPSEDKMEQLKQLATVVNCIYKKRNYIKSNNRLNMGPIKAKANRLYHNDSLKKDFFVNTYRFCGREATQLLNRIKTQANGAQMLKEVHSAYYLFVFVCTQQHSKTDCPYFRWEGGDDSSIESCTDYVNQCKDRYFHNPKMYSIAKESMS